MAVFSVNTEQSEPLFTHLGRRLNRNRRAEAAVPRPHLRLQRLFEAHMQQTTNMRP